MRMLFSLSAAVFLAACGTSTGTRDSFTAGAIRHEMASAKPYEAVYACLVERVPLGASTPMGTPGRAVLLPESRHAELVQSAPNVWGDTTWFWLITIDPGEDGGSVVRSFHNREMDARGHVRSIQACV